ncbi:MAG: N-acetylglutaminylglutamine synthetase [Dichotomicrobium sp.]
MGERDKRVSPEDLAAMASLKHWGARPEDVQSNLTTRNAIVDCGWGRLIFGQTFDDLGELAESLREETEGQRDVAFYVRDPHVLLSTAPQTLFLDPSHTFRLYLTNLEGDAPDPHGFRIRPARPDDAEAINVIYQSHGMVTLHDGFIDELDADNPVNMLVAEDPNSGERLGVVMGVDHVAAFGDPDNGSSLWSLCVDLQAPHPGVGRALVLALAHHFRDAGRSFMDLSVMYDNEEAIQLYRKLGFEQIPVYCIKRKNPINERLFMGPAPEEQLNIYAKIIVDEARRRGIAVEIEDATAGLFHLSFGGRSISCCESLSDMTSAVAMSRCMDKALTQRLLRRGGLKVPEQIKVESDEEAVNFLRRHQHVVVKPAEGEQGRGVFVDLTGEADVLSAVSEARALCATVLMEQFVAGKDLRIIVIDRQVIAAAIRKPAAVVGNGVHDIRDLIEKQSRRREAATGGESRIPIDDETRRSVTSAGYAMDSILPEGEELIVRKTANLHTGGTIHDVTDALHPELADAALTASDILDMPVVGLDFIVPSPSEPTYFVIEANERPGLANHEPQPTAESFIDFLFPQTVTKDRAVRS